MECLLNLPINNETGNRKYSPNKLCSITVRAIWGDSGVWGIVKWVKGYEKYYHTGVLLWGREQ